MKIHGSLKFIIALSLLSCSKTEKKAVDLNSDNRNWHISSSEHVLRNKGLLNIESIIYNEERKVFYMSNGKNYEEGKDGFISKLSSDCKLLELVGVGGLNRPTGMAIGDRIL
jgi:hypothetical protein